MTISNNRGEVLTVAELADELRVGQHAAYSLVASGQIRSVRIGQKGGGIRIPRQALREFLGQQEAK
jgi:excisionase family DNA binding protein